MNEKAMNAHERLMRRAVERTYQRHQDEKPHVGIVMKRWRYVEFLDGLSTTEAMSLHINELPGQL